MGLTPVVAIRSPTEGRASRNAGFQVMADNLQPDKIRERKGMKTELPEAIDDT